MASSSEASLPVGSILAGRYQIRRELGRGGMGFVYLCRDLVLDERVALKLMPRSKMQSGSRSVTTEAREKDGEGGRKHRHDDAWFFYEEARAHTMRRDDRQSRHERLPDRMNLDDRILGFVENRGDLGVNAFEETAGVNGAKHRQQKCDRQNATAKNGRWQPHSLQAKR